MINLIKNKNNSLPQQVNENKLNIELLNKVVIIPNYRGNWTINEQYNIWDIVYNVENGENIAYICVKTIEESGIIDITNTNYWLRITGATGATGEQGEQGVPGDVIHYVNKGEEVPGSSYSEGDIAYEEDIENQPIYYLCIHDVEMQNIPISDDTTNWIRLTGYQGNEGQQGVAGHDGASPSLRNVTITQISSGNPYGLFVIVDSDLLIYDLELYLNTAGVTIHNTGVIGDSTSVYSTQFMNQGILAIQTYINKTFGKTIVPKSDDITNRAGSILTGPTNVCTVNMNSVVKHKYLVSIYGGSAYDTTFEMEYTNYNTGVGTMTPNYIRKSVLTGNADEFLDIYATCTQNNDTGKTVTWDITVTLKKVSDGLSVNVPSGSTITLIEECTETKQNMNLFGQ